MPPKIQVEVPEGDEVIVVTLSREDAKIMRSMIEKEKSLSWLGKWLRNGLFVFAGGILTVVAFGDTFLKLIKSMLGIQ